ncbi:WD40 repeat-like protein [Testicularia cyperi]|uniref:WD40 repeat-like protein n=1 Tax=Testicularia cyperi TaxID=1882483 RepID=A0A317XUW4_9BASI|nr:WD40 repeat-like protein [Testicularia cyperi]
MDDDIEMDEEQHEAEEHEYDEQDDDPEDDMDQGSDDDDNIDDGDDDDDDDADDDDADNDGDDASVNDGRAGSNAPNGFSRTSSESVLSLATYLRKVEERRKLFQPPSTCVDTSLGYQIEPMAAAPHSCHIHAMSLSLDGQTLVTGGSDGFVRKYDLHATMNGKTMLTQNVRHGFVEGITRGGVLTAFWPNEEHPLASSSSHHHISGSSSEKERMVGVVHSLAMQQDALWGASGSESGNIHLYGLRHEPGSTRHVFRRHKGAVSALAVTSDEKHLISGGWDRDVHQWDLNTGQIVRSFPGHAGQISSIAFRPLASASRRRRQNRDASPTISIHHSATGDDDPDTKANSDRQIIKLEEDEKADRPDARTQDSPKPVTHESEGASGDAASYAKKDTNAESAGTASAIDLTSDDEAKADSQRMPIDSSKNGPTTSEPVAATASADTRANQTSKPAPTASTVNGTDDPTEEELAFEAELNASLGLSLDAAGSTKADGSRVGEPKATADGVNTGNGLVVAGADEDADGDGGDDDLFGGDTPPAAASLSSVTDVKRDGDANGAATANDSDGDDSLFGGDDEDADGEGDGDGEGEHEMDLDADGDDASSDEDMPLAGRVMAKTGSTSGLPSAAASPSLMALPTPSSSQPPVTIPTPPLGSDNNGKTSSSSKASAKSAKGPKTKAESGPPKKLLPKPAFGGFGISASYDAPVDSFSPDVMMTTTLSGQVILWDLRCPSYSPSSGVHSLALPDRVPPWAQSSIFSSDGQRVYVGRRNESVDEWDLRTPTRYLRSLRLPSGSGPVYSLTAMPNSRHIITGSYDNIRLWDTEFQPGPGAGGELKVPFKIVAGHHGASLSSVLVDNACQFLISASGDRGWMSTSTEAVIVHDIKAIF